MQVSLKSIFLFLAVCFIAIQTQAQDTEEEDRENYHLRKFDEQKVENYKKSKDFQYDHTIAPPDPSLLQRAVKWLKDLLQLSTDTQDKRSAWSYIFYGISVLTLLYLILRLMNVGVTGTFYRRARRSKVPFGEFMDNINELNFDKLIAEAIAQKMYEQAIRLLYLRTLKNLSDKKLITWEKDKTNRDYIRELRQSKLIDEFKDLTFTFEYVCYGNLSIRSQDFEEACQSFEKFNHTLTKERKANAV